MSRRHETPLQVRLLDGGDGAHVLPESEFDQIWRGRALTVTSAERVLANTLWSVRETRDGTGERTGRHLVVRALDTYAGVQRSDGIGYRHSHYICHTAVLERAWRRKSGVRGTPLADGRETQRA